MSRRYCCRDCATARRVQSDDTIGWLLGIALALAVLLYLVTR